MKRTRRDRGFPRQKRLSGNRKPLSALANHERSMDTDTERQVRGEPQNTSPCTLMGTTILSRRGIWGHSLCKEEGRDRRARTGVSLFGVGRFGQKKPLSL